MPSLPKTAVIGGGALLWLLISCYAVLQSLDANRQLTDTRKRLKKEQELRKMERTGRTKAERRLRLELKALIRGQTDGGVNLKPVARMQSPFKGRCGTPRQGLLAPNAKGQIKLEPGVCRTSLDQLDKFTHLWVIFLFDQNTNWTDALCSDSQRFTYTAKIAPPRLFGKRVGVFSTRSPHRPNPIGLSVVAIDSVDEEGGIIHVSGVDLTDGTPILDLKPYIPYDLVLDHQVPSWVMADDVPAWQLRIAPEAEIALSELAMERNSPFYSTYEDLVALLRDVLLQDVRSIHKGRGTTVKAGNGTKSGNEAPESFTCNIDDIAIEFVALKDAIHILRCFEECRDALDPEPADDAVVAAEATGTLQRKDKAVSKRAASTTSSCLE
ncbi:Hypothetical protein NocV09_02000460 [Nannochloropsis oceanica]